ncbi:hypothetical protein [Sphingobium sp. EP60837]|uniref:hypothetical protein n=1 Tax=Sphingobium sp. EP60837 TaxID=1855519 RepID=UPI0007DCD54E|nr:hypothetical protein [Sphingobium sp. EP60837]ANI79043.1 hypothetical protein EP837_02648 [Sphingobium sp. EP60837]
MSYFKTAIHWLDGEEEREAYVGVRYTGHKGFRGDHIDPPEPASVEIQEIKVLEGDSPVPDEMYYDDDLLAECLQDWAEEAIEAAEWEAQSRRDRLMEGF